MRNLSIFICGICLFFLMNSAGLTKLAPPCFANNDIFHEFLSFLTDAGLENLQVQLTKGQTVWIRYENRLYRNQTTALGIVLNYAALCFPFAKQFVIVPHYQDLPIRFIQINKKVYEQFINHEISASEFLDNLQTSYQPLSEEPLPGFSSQLENPSLFKLDVILSPGFKAQFAQPNDPAQLQFNFLTDLRITLAPGLQFNGQAIFPIYNEFQSSESQPRLGQCYFNQLLRLPLRSLLSFSAGIFEQEYYGISARLKQFVWRDQLSFSTRLDYLHTCSLAQRLLSNPSCQNQLSYLFQTQYRFAPLCFETRLTWGRYALGDIGWRLDIIRTFHEFELGFMGVWNKSLEFLTGMTVRIPFPVYRQARPGSIRIAAPQVIPWNYRYLPCYDGLILDTGVEFDEIDRQFSKSYIRANMHQLQYAMRYVRRIQSTQSTKFLARWVK